MSEALVPAAAAEPVVVADGEADVVLPALIVDAGPDAVARFLEFFAGRIANARTRAAYGRAVGQFLGWCEARGLGLRDVSPLHVAALHPDAPRVGPHGEAAPGRDPHARRLARRQPGPPREPRRGGSRPEARRHQGRSTGSEFGGRGRLPRRSRPPLTLRPAARGRARRAPRLGCAPQNGRSPPTMLGCAPSLPRDASAARKSPGPEPPPAASRWRPARCGLLDRLLRLRFCTTVV